MAVAGVARVFNAFYGVLTQMEDFSRIWALLLEFVEKSSSEPSCEVAKAAIVALQDVFKASATTTATSDESGSQQPAAAEDPEWWLTAWQIWLHIAKTTARRRPVMAADGLAAMIDSFPPLYAHLRDRFTVTDAARMMSMVRELCDLQHHTALSTSTMTVVQTSALKALQAVLPSDGGDNTEFVPAVLNELASLASFGCDPPPPPAAAEGEKPAKVRIGACAAFSIGAMDEISRIYARCACTRVLAC